MITNGALLGPSVLEHLTGLSLKQLEISLDGLPETYARRKGLPLDRALAVYDFLTRAAGPLIEAVGSLMLRINVDRENVDEAKELVRRMLRASPDARRIEFRLQVLSAGKGLIECIPHHCYSRDESAEVREEFESFLASQGLPAGGPPRRLNLPCMAVRHQAFTVAPDGRIGKCVPATGLPGNAFLTLDPADPAGTLARLDAVGHPYADFDPFLTPTCSGCPFLPVCLGQCPRDHGSADFVCTRRVEFEARLSSMADTIFTPPERSASMSRDPHWQCIEQVDKWLDAETDTYGFPRTILIKVRRAWMDYSSGESQNAAQINIILNVKSYAEWMGPIYLGWNGIAPGSRAAILATSADELCDLASFESIPDDRRLREGRYLDMGAELDDLLVFNTPRLAFDKLRLVLPGETAKDANTDGKCLGFVIKQTFLGAGSGI